MKKHQTTRKQVRILLIALCILIAVAFLMFLGPAFVSTATPNNAYIIEITGIGSLDVNGTATVMIPVPANAEGEPVMSEVFSSKQVFGWRTAIRETPYGKMLAFTTTDGYGPSISVPFGEFETKEEPRLLVPVLATPDNMSVEEFSRTSGGTYTTVVFLDGFIPPPENATPITFNLRYQGGGGMKHLIKENVWTATVNATVPGTASGFIPVPAEYHVTPGGIYL
ncbi:hypothetical protein [Methanoculleus bourgensis]|uniref:hypothetical protein n=1 Tax=Methanoculleus bourgensis TaxID=83986 RepID=UPI0022EE0D54|nr:hypothetical protein [Methanoculleus bourgensis]GLI45337.1 hypothetical protein MBOURGENBZM_01290 [Methanoculleus bourgensis]